jgi:hypothetical protein
MSLSFPLRSQVGSASAGTLAAPITSSTTTFTSSTTISGLTDASNNSLTGNIVVTVDYGTANAEKILCTYNSGSGVFTIVQRNYDNGTYNTATSHPTGTLFVFTYSATEAAEAAVAVQSLKHVLTAGASGSYSTPSNISIDGTATVGTATNPAHGDHNHIIASTSLNSWLTTSATGTLSASVTIPATQVSSGTLPSGVVIPYSQVTSTPTIPASAGVTAAGPTSNLTTSSTTSVVTAINPGGSGAYANYHWSASAVQYTAASGSTDVNAVLLYRVAGSGGAWTVGQTIAAGIVGTTNYYTHLGVTGVMATPSSGVDYEFGLAFTTSSSVTGLQVAKICFTVIGTN